MQRRLQALAASEPFQDAVLGLIVLNGLCMGVEAVPELAEDRQELLFWVFAISQVAFVVEIAVRVLACWPRPGDFFRNGWNTFDFTVVALSLLPAVGGLTLAARLLRILRLLRVVSMSDALRGLAGRGRPTLALPAALLVLLNYMLALAGFHLFGELDADRWGNLGRAVSSLAALLWPGRARPLIASLYGAGAWAPIYLAIVYVVNLGLLTSVAIALLGKRRVATGTAG
jgi:voltage-gated sodium channel